MDSNVNIEIDSMEFIRLLKIGDTVFRTEDKKYMISQISDQHIMLLRKGKFSYLKIFPLTDLIKDRWYLQKKLSIYS